MSEAGIVFFILFCIVNMAAFPIGCVDATHRADNVYIGDIEQEHFHFSECTLKNYHYLVPANHLGCEFAPTFFSMNEWLKEEIK